MKQIFLLLLVVAMVGCKQNSNTASNGVDSSSTQKAGSENGLMGMPKDAPYDAVVIGQGVRSRNAPNQKGEVLRSFVQGELVKIVETNASRTVIAGDDPCDEFGYPWCKVRDHEGKESWIYGKYVFRFQQMRSEKGRVMGGQALEVNGTKYTFQIAADQALGPSNEEGLTGCENMYAPFLYEDGKPNALLIYLDTKKIVADDLSSKAKKFDVGLLLLYAASEGGEDDLEDVRVRAKEPVLELDITHYYQDGSSQGKVVARVAKDRIDVVDYENSGPQL